MSRTSIRQERGRAEDTALRTRLVGAAIVGLVLLSWWWLAWMGIR